MKRPPCRLEWQLVRMREENVIKIIQFVRLFFGFKTPPKMRYKISESAKFKHVGNLAQM